MKLVIYPSRFRDFDGRKLVKTVNKLPQAEHLLVLEQSLDLALDRSCIGVTTLQVHMHNSILYLQLKRLVRVLMVYFGTPSMFITLWFGFDYGTNPPLGTLII
jgi:hypothetical protein